MSTVSVIIVTYNSASVLLKCLDSIIGSKCTSEVIIVDNNSTDASIQISENHPLSPTIIASATNAGFARAVNEAASRARGSYLLLVNPDVVVAPGVIDELSTLLDDRLAIGVAAPVVHERATDKTVPAGYPPTVSRMFLHLSGLSRLGRTNVRLRGHYLLSSQVSGAMSLDWVTGACLMTRNDLWQRLGGLTTRWFMYAEDIEYCLRVKKAGYEVILDSSLTVEHAAGRSSDDADQRVSTQWLSNLYDLYRNVYTPSVVERQLWRALTVVGFGARSMLARDRYNRLRFRRYALTLTRFQSGLPGKGGRGK